MCVSAVYIIYQNIIAAGLHAAGELPALMDAGWWATALETNHSCDSVHYGGDAPHRVLSLAYPSMPPTIGLLYAVIATCTWILRLTVWS